jgi:hypothetical protein
MSHGRVVWVLWSSRQPACLFAGRQKCGAVHRVLPCAVWHGVKFVPVLRACRPDTSISSRPKTGERSRGRLWLRCWNAR